MARSEVRIQSGEDDGTEAAPSRADIFHEIQSAKEAEEAGAISETDAYESLTITIKRKETVVIQTMANFLFCQYLAGIQEKRKNEHERLWAIVRKFAMRWLEK